MEIDFLIAKAKIGSRHNISPIEVKSSTHVKSRSLNNYIKEYHPNYAIRISERNFGFKNNIKSVPLYAVFGIGKIEREKKNEK